jgi:hypothetical protein
MRLTRHRNEGAHASRHAVDDVRDRFGGLDLPAAFAGTFAALGAVALLSALAASWLNAYDAQLTRSDLVSTTGGAIALGILVLSGLFGGWVTGRCSRYEGAGNGVLTGLLLILLGAGLTSLAASQSQDDTAFSLPSWVTEDATSNSALVGLAIALAVVLVATTIGGLLGSSWHRRVDRALVRNVEDNDFVPYPDFDRDADRSDRRDADTRTT